MPRGPDSLVRFCDQFPPFLVLFMAKRKERRIPIEEVGRLCNVPSRTLFRLRSLTSWSGVSLQMIERVTEACGYNIMQSGASRAKLKRAMSSPRPLKHLPKAQAAAFVAKMKQYMADRSRHSAARAS